MELYGVKVIYKHKVCSDPPSDFFELQVLTVEAEDFDDAFKKAEKYAEDYCFKYVNINGDKVITEIYSLEDCYVAADEEDGVREVYSCITKGDGAGDVWSSSCLAEDMMELRNIEFN